MSCFGPSCIGIPPGMTGAYGVERDKVVPMVDKCYHSGSRFHDPQDSIGKYVGVVDGRHIFHKKFRNGTIEVKEIMVDSDVLRGIFERPCHPLDGGRRRNKHKKTKKARRNKSHTRKN